MLIRPRRFLAALATILVAACTGTPSGVEPVGQFETERYLGTWYEIMRLDHRFERGLTNVTATYSLREDGRIGVLNRGFDPERCAWREAEGLARFRDSPEVASLAVTFQWPFAGGYHVIALDRVGYRYALVSGPSRDYLWVLARTPDLDEATRERLVGEAARLGFPVEELIQVDHSEPTCVPGSPSRQAAR